MYSFVLGLIWGICLTRIFIIIRMEKQRKKIKAYEVHCSTPQELEKALKEIVREIEDDQQKRKEME